MAVLCDQVPVRRRFVGEGDLTSFLAYDPGKERDLLIEEEAEEEHGPRLMRVEAVVVGGGRFFYLGKLVPGYGREVVVLVVIANVEGYGIQHAVIAKGLLLFVVREIMLLDPAGAKRMEADGEEEDLYAKGVQGKFQFRDEGFYLSRAATLAPRGK